MLLQMLQCYLLAAHEFIAIQKDAEAPAEAQKASKGKKKEPKEPEVHVCKLLMMFGHVTCVYRVAEGYWEAQGGGCQGR